MTNILSAAGATLPGFTILFGSLINSFNPASGSVTHIGPAVNDVCLKFVYIGIATMVASYLEVAAWMAIGAHAFLASTICAVRLSCWVRDAPGRMLLQLRSQHGCGPA